MSHAARTILVTCLVLLLAGPALAQLDDLERVDQGVADLGGLSTSLRHLDPGLQQPVGFQQLYRVPGSPNEFMRVDGGLYAVFSRSVYESTRNGVVPVVPPGTVFYIGAPPGDPAGDLWAPHVPQGRAGATRRIDDAGRVASPPALERSRYATGTPALPRATARTVVTDPEYRAERLRTLMQRAVEGTRKRRAGTG